MKKLLTALFAIALSATAAMAANKYDNPDTIVVARDGTGEFRNISEAIEVCRAFMDYHKVIYVKRGTYKEKLEIPTHLTNIEICGEDALTTIITWDDHANIMMPSAYDPIAIERHPTADTQHPTPSNYHPIGTFRTFTLRVCGSDITLKNITIENNSARLGQAVALHTEGDRLRFIGCRFLGHQDTVYTGRGGTRLLFRDCYIEGTTDFIFGPSTAWFENCTIKSKANSYITAASTPADVEYGYVFNRCRLIADEGVTKVYLGRPWRPYAYTLFMNCTLGSHIVPAGWENWRNPDNEKTARYAEYNNSGEGANTKQRVAWSRQLTKKEVEKIPQFFGL
ncbi:MAG: pectinesterase family protein [Prevotellaceae bacterium]|nr:pectinesterase family protein [Prevotellaceae bacterium]